MFTEQFLRLLVSTYVVCERLSVMHEPAGVVEILVQIRQNTPILKYSFRIPPPPKIKIVRDLGTLTFQFQNTPHPPPPHPKNWNLGRSWHFDFSVSEYPPQNENCQRSWHFDFSVSEYPPTPKMKIVRDLGTLTFQFQNTPRSPPPPTPDNWNLGRSWHFDFSVSQYPLPPRKWKLSEILPLWLFSFRIPPLPPPRKIKNLGRSWHCKTFQFQNYVWQVTTCGDFIQPG